MTREEAKAFVGKVYKFYGDKFSMNQEQFDIWFACLEDLRVDVMEKAFTEYVKESKFPPTIADLREKYGELWSAYKLMLIHIEECFKSASGIYPCKTDEQEERARKIFYTTVGKFPRNERESAASSMTRKIVDYVKEVERGTSKTITPFDKYMEQISNEFTSRAERNRVSIDK